MRVSLLLGSMFSGSVSTSMRTVAPPSARVIRRITAITGRGRVLEKSTIGSCNPYMLSPVALGRLHARLHGLQSSSFSLSSDFRRRTDRIRARAEAQ